MKLTKKHLRQIIREELQVLSEHDRRHTHNRFVDVHKGGLSAEFDNESVKLSGEYFDQEELALEVSNEEDWDDNFDRMGAFAAKALRDKHGVVTVTDKQQPGKAWTVDDFIELKKSIAAEYDED